MCPNLKERIIILNGVSKAYSMTGWRIGYAAGSKDIIKKMKTLQSQSTSCASSISQAAACAALSQDCKELPSMKEQYKIRHDFVVDQLNKIDGVVCKETDGTFYVFPSFTKYIEKSSKINNDDELAMLDQLFSIDEKKSRLACQIQLEKKHNGLVAHLLDNHKL